MIKKNKNLYCNSQSGSSLLEVLLSIGIIALLSPFIYGQILNTVRDIHDVSIAKQITNSRGSALNFLRLNQDKWPEVAQIKLSEDELKLITPAAHAGFIDKYKENGQLKTEIYLAFDIDDNILHATKVAKNVGADAAAINSDGIAYGDYWAATAPEFKAGDVIYHIDHNFSSDNISKYLHRSTSGEDELNFMERDLDMGKKNIYKIGSVSAKSGKITDVYSYFVNAENMKSGNIYFSRGANIDGNDVKIKSLKVSGDLTGFREIKATKLNNNTYSNVGNIITDKATISESVFVGNNLTVKSDSSRTLSGFSGISTHALYLPYLSTDELTFHNNFGITVSGELLQSTVSPIKFGSWYFPNTTPPSFEELNLSKVSIPTTPNSDEFSKLMTDNWKD